ncbi:protein trichome birefringence-like 3 isoform X2 [Nymphaea colorata]|uniref:protein trichome birefringence-like 3 isoform X2 n=1 Tax=Nymphaea colorata TaxID=210225 RepID=UPI00129DFB78|nr:protein trichome birefringence-like 3 isoform X2 [Nymphaea colorata]
MKPARGSLRLSGMATTIIVVTCAIGFASFLYLEDIAYLARASVSKLGYSCTIRDQVLKADAGVSSATAGKTQAMNRAVAGKGEEEDKKPKEMTQEMAAGAMHGRAGGGRKARTAPECNVVEGNWVFNRSVEPLYSDRSCPYLDRQVQCENNGRPDTDYKYWHWQPDNCDLPRFDAAVALERLKGKRMMFVGDSLQKGMWLSFVCSVESHIPELEKSLIRRGRDLSIFVAKKYNVSIEFYWAPFLVESNSDNPIISDPRKRILRVDSIYKHARHWMDADIFVFNTYVWWMNGFPINSLWGSFKNGEEGYEELDAPTAYMIGLKTWANWVDSTVDPNRTRVFFTTMSPTHMRSADWNKPQGIRCYNETTPMLQKGYWGSGSSVKIMGIVDRIVKRMKVPVTFINITQLSEHRKDGHTSVYTEFKGKIMTEEHWAQPQQYADCIHWCLPGVPDTWNQLLLTYL